MEAGMEDHLSTGAGAGVPSRALGIALRITGWLLQALAAVLIAVVVLLEVLDRRLLVVPEAGVWPLSVMPDVGMRSLLGAWLLCAVAAVAALCGMHLDARARWRLAMTADPAGTTRRRRVGVVVLAANVGGLLACASMVLTFTMVWTVVFGGGVAAGTPLVQRVLLCAVVLVGAMPSLVYTRRTLRYARRSMAPVLSSPADLGDRPFVLYLRSFSADEEGYFMPPSVSGGRFPVSKFLFPDALFDSVTTHEETIAGGFARFGEVVAVGRPGERMPYPGATRFYLPLEGWQPVVSDLIRRAQLVLLLAGTGPGTLWEFTEAVRLLPPSRLVLLVQDDADGYDQFRRAANVAFAERAEELRRTGDDAPQLLKLPAYPPLRWPERVRVLPVLKGVIRFGAAWNPAFERLDPSLMPLWQRQGMSYQLDGMLKRIAAQLPATPAPGRGRTRRPVLGWAVHGVTVLLALAGTTMVVWTVLYDAGDKPVSMKLVGSFLSVWVGLLGASVTRLQHRWARSNTARLLQSAAEIGPDPCVLFLRPAPDDVPLFVDSPDLRSSTDVVSPWLQFSAEEELGRIFAPYGKLIAAGGPGETRGWPGVTRLYLPPDGWQATLSEAITRCRLVVMTAGTAPQTLWALTEAVHLLPPSRLLLLVPAEPDAYKAFRRAAAKAFTDRLGELKRSRGPSFRPPRFPTDPFDRRRAVPSTLHGPSLSSAIFFTAGWRPVFVPLDDPQRGYQASRRERRQQIQTHLRPHLAHLELGPDNQVMR
jgi:hypothetical protein